MDGLYYSHYTARKQGAKTRDCFATYPPSLNKERGEDIIKGALPPSTYPLLARLKLGLN